MSPLHSEVSPPICPSQPLPGSLPDNLCHRHSREGAQPKVNCSSPALGWGEVQEGDLGFNLRPVWGGRQEALKPNLLRPTPAIPQACLSHLVKSR